MKLANYFLIGALVHFAISTARANVFGSEDFNDNTENATKWGADSGFGTPPGVLTQTNGHIEFTSSGTVDTYQARPWMVNYGSFTANWEVQLDTSVLAAAGDGHNFGVGIEIWNAKSPNQYVGIEHENSGTGLDFASYIAEVPDQPTHFAFHPAGTAGAVRVAYNEATHVLTTYYDADGAAGGYKWKAAATYGVADKGGATGNANWHMTKADTFQIVVFGYSSGAAAPAGMVFADNFQATASGGLFGTQAGVYNALVGSDGFVTVTLGAKGGFTGKLVQGGVTYSLGGNLNAAGDSTGNIAKPTLPVSLHVDAGAQSATLGGLAMAIVANGTALTAYHAAYSTGQTPTEASLSTVLLKPTGTTTDIPQGIGFATLTVGKSGAAKLAGKLADGTTLSGAGLLVGDGQGHDQFVLFNNTVYGGAGRVSGAIVFEPLADSECDSMLTWKKPKPKTGAYYANGIDTTLALMGMHYAAPQKNTPAPPFSAGSGNAHVNDPSFTPAIGETLTVTPKNAVTVNGANLEKLKITVNAAKGTFTGSFLHPVSHKATSFNGVLYQNANVPQGGGFYLGPVVGGIGYSGFVSLTP